MTSSVINCADCGQEINGILSPHVIRIEEAVPDDSVLDYECCWNRQYPFTVNRIQVKVQFLVDVPDILIDGKGDPQTFRKRIIFIPQEFEGP